VPARNELGLPARQVLVAIVSGKSPATGAKEVTSG